jgi:hypothetical protein
LLSTSAIDFCARNEAQLQQLMGHPAAVLA